MLLNKRVNVTHIIAWQSIMYGISQLSLQYTQYNKVPNQQLWGLAGDVNPFLPKYLYIYIYIFQLSEYILQTPA